jgi:maltose alpha-D-glucosyltransferase/alpha-amylase
MEEHGREIGPKVPWLPAARWFAMKGGDGSIVLHDAARLPLALKPTPHAMWLGLVDLVDAGGQAAPAARYFVPLVEADGTLVDASRNDAFVGWILRVVLDEASLPAGLGSFRGHSPVRGNPPTSDARLSIADVGGDASNTSIAVSYGGGPAVIVKLVRRCRSGTHPEVEVGHFLAKSPVRADVPKLLGWIDYVPNERAGDAGPATVVIVHERVDARGSAWDVMLATAEEDWPRCLELAASLGETTARLHAALASRNDDPAFAPEPWTADDWQAATRRMTDHASHVLDRVEQLRGAASVRLAGRVASMRSRIMASFSEQATEPPSSHRIRVHGDYHLGQVLVGRGDDRCVVIDFEGEPARSLAERREKTSAAKDVAGMCRSFDYLLRVLAKDGRRPYTVGDLASLESTFLSAYETTSHSLAAERPEARWWPEDRRETDRLLAVYKLDKALYEVAYEADHRPDWTDVPLAAVAARDFGGM